MLWSCAKPKPTASTGTYQKPLQTTIKILSPAVASTAFTPYAVMTAPKSAPKPKEKKVDLDELDKRIERRTKYPITGERTKDLFFDLLDEVPGVSNAKHAVEKASRAALEMQVGRSLDYETPQEAEETIKYATEVAGSRLGWSEEKTETINKFGPNAPISFGQLESEKAKVLKEIEDKKDERDENGDS